MEKDTYLFSEVVIGLRSEYLKNQRLLDKLNKYIRISDDRMVKSLFCDLSPFSRSNEIFMYILKRQNKLQKFIDYIGFEFFNAPCHEMSPLYSLKKENKYTIEVNNKKEVIEIIDELNNSLLMKTKHLYESLSQFQTISISPRQIYMRGNFDDLNISTSFIRYESENDIFVVYPGVKNGLQLVNTYFNTEIPKDIIPEEYRKIIDENLKKYIDIRDYGAFEIDCPIEKPIELSINEANNKVVLKKKRLIKFYE